MAGNPFKKFINDLYALEVRTSFRIIQLFLENHFFFIAAFIL